MFQDDEHNPVVLVDGTVRRRSRWWSSSVHDLLSHLADIGSAHSPRPLGFDDSGRETLSYIEGDSGRDAGSRVARNHQIATRVAEHQHLFR